MMDPNEALKKWKEDSDRKSDEALSKMEKLDDLGVPKGLMVAAGCAGVILTLAKLAILVIICWGIFELVTWLVSK